VIGSATSAQIAAEISRFSSLVWHRGLVEAAGGNISARLPGTDAFAITATGFTLRELPDSALVEIGISTGQMMGSSPELRPSKETGMHVAFYRQRPEAGAVIHCHPPYLVAYSAFCKPLPMPTVTALGLLKFVPAVATAWSGSEKLHLAVERALADYPDARAVILQHHGVIACGGTLEEAFNRIDLVEKTARVWYLMQATGAPMPDPSTIG
jgi:L-fuculose-phosphate aldolase